MNQYEASLSYATSSPIKMELVAKLARGKDTTQALELLHFLPKKAARTLSKVIRSAQANAKSAEGDDVASVISTIDVGPWPKLKRMRFASRARIHGYTRHRSFVRVVLTTK